MAESPLVVKDAALEIARLIEEAEQVILADIAYRMAMGEDMTDPQWRKRLLSDNEAIKRDVEALFADLDEEAAEEIDRIFTEAYEKGWKADEDGWSKQGFAVSDWESLKSYMPTGLAPSLLRLAAETKMKVGSMTRPILRQIDDFYRQAQGDALKRAMTQGMTRIQATQQMMNRLADKGISNFIDKAGRQWDAASYAEMAIRTGAMHCYREGFIDSVVARGYNLVYISYHPGACPLCRPWQNKVLQIADAEERQAGTRALTTKQKGGIIKTSEGVGRMKSGAFSGALNPNSREAFEHANRYYAEVRKMKNDCATIAVNVGWNEEAVRKIKDHIFNNKYDLGGPEPERFDPDYHMAISWQRLIDGRNIKEMDLVLLKHEYYELTLMKSKGLSYRKAHEIAQSRHNYSRYVNEEASE